MTPIRRLDHVAVAVRETASAVAAFQERLGLAVSHHEELADPPVRLTYLDAGNCFIQLVEPLSPAAGVSAWLNAHGEGLHHVCFAVDDVAEAIVKFGDGAPAPPLGSGRGRVSGFVPGAVAGVQAECTEFSLRDDVVSSPGWLADR